MNKIKCKRCGHEWEPRTDNPKACPRCKRYDYDKAAAQAQAVKDYNNNKQLR